MSGPSQRSMPPAFAAMLSAISSQGSAGGRSPSASRAGATAPSGPAAARASRSPRRARASGKRTRGTSGPSFDASSPSAVLQSSLASRLHASVDLLGSPEFVLTWRQQDMPSGGPICRLAARARRTSETAFSGWPTPCTSEGRGADPSPPESKYRASGHWRMLTLERAASFASWPTPTATDAERRGNVTPVSAALNLNGAATLASLAGWPTPLASDDKGTSGGRGRDSNPSLRVMAGWATPAARDDRHPNARSYADRGGGTKGEQLPNQVHQLLTPDPGTPSPSSSAKTARCGVLNPEFSRWLMGYPAAWGSCGATAMRSSRKSRRGSSKPT